MRSSRSQTAARRRLLCSVRASSARPARWRLPMPSASDNGDAYRFRHARIPHVMDEPSAAPGRAFDRELPVRSPPGDRAIASEPVMPAPSLPTSSAAAGRRRVRACFAPSHSSVADGCPMPTPPRERIRARWSLSIHPTPGHVKVVSVTITSAVMPASGGLPSKSRRSTVTFIWLCDANQAISPTADPDWSPTACLSTSIPTPRTRDLPGSREGNSGVRRAGPELHGRRFEAQGHSDRRCFPPANAPSTAAPRRPIASGRRPNDARRRAGSRSMPHPRRGRPA